MDFAAQVLLESPIQLGIFSFILFAIVLMIRGRLPGRGAKIALPGVLLIIALLFVVQRLVVTQREEIWARLEEFIAAVEGNDRPGIARGLADSYESEGMDRKAMLSFIDGRLAVLRVYDSRVTDRDVKIDGERADMDLMVAATVSIEGGVGDRHVGRWRIGWVRGRDGWRISSIAPRMIDLVQISTLREIRGLTP